MSNAIIFLSQSCCIAPYLKLYSFLMLAINLFGSPEVLLDGRPITIERRKSRALLYFLAASERPYQREQLLAFFWPDMERQAAQQVLRTSLHGLHKALGEDLVIAREALSLAQDTQVDARMFEKNLSPIPGDIAKLESILLLYRGAFLTNFSLPDTQSFEDWENAERERYQRLFVRAVYALSRSYEGFGDYKAALAAMDRGLAIDPLQEDLQREAIRLAYLAGDRPESIRRYDQLRKLLDEELGVPPMVETRALYDDILNDRVKTPQPQTLEMARPTRTAKASTPAGMLPFISREAELKTLTEGILTNRLLLVEGEPGIGKSRLVEQFIGTLPDTIQLSGAGRELELALPYQPVIEALRGLQTLPDWPALLAGVRKDLPELWLREAARLMPELGAPAVRSSTAEEWRLWEGISQFLLALAKAKPVLLFIDDLHWADPSTMGLLGYLVRHAPGSRLSILAAARPFATRSPLGNLASALTRENRLTRIALDRFSEQDVAKIAEKLSPRQAPELAAWLLRNSEGNPYILSELVWHARRSHLLADDGTLDLDALSSRPVVPQSVYSLIESRLANMSEPARRILDVAVAVGRDFDFDLVTRASAVSEEAALDGLDELIELGLVHPDGNMRYRFDHSLTMEVAFREIGEARHRLLHRRIAEAMESMYTRTRPDNLPGLLAFHYSEGNDPRRAAPYAFQAGQSAVRLAAWSEAIAFFEQGLVGTEGWPRFPILMELGSAFYQAGQTAQAGETFQSAVALAESHGRQQQINAARLKLAETYLSQARFAESIKQAQKVIQSGRDEDIFRAEMWWGTTLSVEGADLAGAEEHLMRAVNFCREQKDIEALAQLEFELG
ncbi:MAG TPA: AAA family ATPase, partial [Anaerolineales bacterium]